MARLQRKSQDSPLSLQQQDKTLHWCAVACTVAEQQCFAVSLFVTVAVLDTHAAFGSSESFVLDHAVDSVTPVVAVTATAMLNDAVATTASCGPCTQHHHCGT